MSQTASSTAAPVEEKKTAATATAATTVPKKIEDDDDEFEEFETEWNEQDEDVEDKKLWEDNWDDDQLSDFENQLRAELDAKKTKGK